jgi:glycosyltransferase involved in cell wall biosynthesis
VAAPLACLCNTNRAWGGGEAFVHRHAGLLAQRGWQVHVAAHTDSALADRLEAAGRIPVHRFAVGALTLANPATMIRLRTFFRRLRPDVVLCALPRDLKAFGLAARWAGIPRVAYRRGIGVPVRNTALNRHLLGRVADVVICNSEDTRACLLAENPDLVPAERIRVIPNGFDTAAFDALPGEPSHPGPAGVVTIGTAGRLTKQKAQHHLLEAAALLRERGHDLRVLLAGSGELEASLRARARELGLDGVAHFLGFVDDLKSFYASLDIFALPSHWEGFGYVLAEAMAMELPVAAFDAGSIPEVVAHGQTGLLARPFDSASLADALQQLVTDADLRRRLGAAGRGRVLERFDVSRTMDAFEAALRG